VSFPYNGRPRDVLRCWSSRLKELFDRVRRLENQATQSFSTEEQPTGRRWIDNRPTYWKTLEGNGLPNTTTDSIQHGVDDLDKVVDLYGWAWNGSTSLPLPYVEAGGTFHAQLHTVSDSVVVTTNSNLSSYDTNCVVMEYTKTTD
jgi:hypothetical protein